jgi:hypothetical protein
MVKLEDKVVATVVVAMGHAQFNMDFADFCDYCCKWRGSSKDCYAKEKFHKFQKEGIESLAWADKALAGLVNGIVSWYEDKCHEQVDRIVGRINYDNNADISAEGGR